MSKLFLTGVTGFLGAHIAAAWLNSSKEHSLMTLVRATTWQEADHRLKHALSIAFHEQGERSPTAEQLSRAVAVPGDILDISWAAEEAVRGWWGTTPGIVEVIHSAAALSFSSENRDFVFEVNLTGTRRLLDAIAALPSPLAVNHISTAYVAGNVEGVIPEKTIKPPAFNNPYEHSKYVCERVVQAVLDERGIPWRIFRPSIIIGHSATHRVSSEFGFYKVLSTFNRLASERKIKIAPVVIPFKRNATIDLIPVDIVVEEMLTLIDAGTTSYRKIFHLTNEHPLTVADVFFGIAPLAGLPIVLNGDGSRGRSALDILASHAVCHYLPYFAQARVFDRTNVRRLGADHRQSSYRLDLVRLRRFTEIYFKNQRAELRAQVAAATTGEISAAAADATQATRVVR